MDGDQRLGAFIGLLVCMALLGLMGACTYNERDDRVQQTEIVRTCLENGGEWRQEQIDGDYSPEHSCVRTGVDNR